MPASPSTPLWSAPFRFAQPALLRPRATLFADRLELTGWRLPCGRYRRVVRLQRLLHETSAPDMLVLWQTGGDVLRLRVSDAAQWKHSASNVSARSVK